MQNDGGSGALKGQISIVTGAGTGIGRETALKFAAEGATVVIAGRRPEPLDRTVADIAAAGGRAVARPTDLADGDAAEALGRWTLDEYERVDILVNNAGQSSRVRSIRYVDAAEWDAVFNVNVTGVFRLTQSVMESMIARGGGTVITVSSMAAINPGLLGGAPYSAAKAASFNMMRNINGELRAQGLRACTIIPAEVDTPILDRRPLPPDGEARATMMQPEDVADAILLCAAMPARTIVEQIVLLPTTQRDISADIETARNLR